MANSAGLHAVCLQGLDLFKGTAFSTTQSFTTTHGFVVSTPPASCSAPAPADRQRSSSSCSDSGNSSASERDNVQPADKPSTPVGWSGLLEISKGGGGTGLMGSVSGSVEQELEGHVEVACTAHASTGVRRLVKSVVRGIKVRTLAAVASRTFGNCPSAPACAGRVLCWQRSWKR